jgi:hypothetical protein
VNIENIKNGTQMTCRCFCDRLHLLNSFVFDFSLGNGLIVYFQKCLVGVLKLSVGLNEINLPALMVFLTFMITEKCCNGSWM